MPWDDGRDAEFPAGIGAGYGGRVAGYYGGPQAAHIWTQSDWVQFNRNRKLPIWVAGFNGEQEGVNAVQALKALGVPSGCYTVLDVEARRDKSYCEGFATQLWKGGYLVMVYGSLNTVFGNPQLNGYWVGDWTGEEHMATNPDTGNSRGIRGTQWTSGPDYDTTAWKKWTAGNFWL